MSQLKYGNKINFTDWHGTKQFIWFELNLNAIKKGRVRPIHKQSIGKQSQSITVCLLICDEDLVNEKKIYISKNGCCR